MTSFIDYHDVVSLSVLSIALLRQSDPNWGAFFFITDDKPFEKRLNEILGKFSDPRIEYVDVPMIFRPKVSDVIIILVIIHLTF